MHFDNMNNETNFLWRIGDGLPSYACKTALSVLSLCRTVHTHENSSLLEVQVLYFEVEYPDLLDYKVFEIHSNIEYASWNILNAFGEDVASTLVVMHNKLNTLDILSDPETQEITKFWYYCTLALPNFLTYPSYSFFIPSEHYMF